MAGEQETKASAMATSLPLTMTPFAIHFLYTLLCHITFTTSLSTFDHIMCEYSI